MSIADEGSAPRLLWAAGARLGEGALWDDRLARLWWVDIDGCRLHRMDEAGGDRRSWTLPEPVGHVALTADPGQVILGLASGHVLFDWRDEHRAALAKPAGLTPRHRLNDGKVDGQGRLWFGTMQREGAPGEGALHRLDRDGTGCILAGLAVPNGPAFAPDGRSMMLADSPARTVWAFELEDGRPVRRREVLRLAEPEGYPDGMTMDAEGCLLLAHWEGGRVSRVAPDGRRLGSVALPTPRVTSCAFGGADMRTLFVTTAGGPGRDGEGPAGGVFALRLAVAGRPANRAVAAVE